MKQLTAQAILDIGGPRANPAIAAGTIASLAWLDRYGMTRPAILAHFLAQCGEESDHFHTLEEYASGAAYEGRRDLGNTQPGDGKRFKGRGELENTGRTNARLFTAWIRLQIADAPDFEAHPELQATFPWAVYVAVWYWQGHDLNRLALEDNVETITHRINGGLNGLGERLVMLGRASLVLLGYGAGDLKRFQTEAGLVADGVLGAKSRTALHAKLLDLPAHDPATMAVHAPPEAPVPVTEAPAIRPPPEPIDAPAATPAPAVAPPTPPSARRSLWRFLLSLLGL